ncbi:MAG: CoA pyrophosphatase [Magnetococcales bacterium]|nr:CoA pyrophosphatase [Magnetococcales bacterium]
MVARCIPSLDARENGETQGQGILSSVLVPLLFPDGGMEEGCRLLFIRRSQQVRHHKGQIAFPGGRCEPWDRSVLETALRETIEELGPQARPARILGRLPPVATVVTGFIIHPFVGVFSPEIKVQPEPREVDAVLTVPLSFFLSEGKAAPERYQYGSHVIWGATARIINQFVAFLMKDGCA